MEERETEMEKKDRELE